MEDIFTQLHEAVAAACHRDLDDLLGYNDTKRRPTLYDVQVCMFPQTWGSTSLGYGGIGGSAMTTAYTIVVSRGREHCVYFGCGRLAYKVRYSGKTSNEYAEFVDDLHKQCLTAVWDAKDGYNAEVPE